MIKDGFNRLIDEVLKEDAGDEEMLEADLDDIKSLQNLFIDYHGCVCRHTVENEMNKRLVASGRQSEAREKMLYELDCERRRIHNKCVIKCQYINRLNNDVLGLEPFLPDTPEELDVHNLDDPNNALAAKVRHELTEYIGEFIIMKFQSGTLPDNTYHGVYIDTAVETAKNTGFTKGYEHVEANVDDLQM